jgi:hypothetical protein
MELVAGGIMDSRHGRLGTDRICRRIRARLAAIPSSENAHHSWHCGWEDGDTEALELARHKRVLAEGREDGYSKTLGL